MTQIKKDIIIQYSNVITGLIKVDFCVRYHDIISILSSYYYFSMSKVKKGKGRKTVAKTTQDIIPVQDMILDSNALNNVLNQVPDPTADQVKNQALPGIAKTLCRTQRYDAVISDIFADMPVPGQEAVNDSANQRVAMTDDDVVVFQPNTLQDATSKSKKIKAKNTKTKPQKRRRILDDDDETADQMEIEQITIPKEAPVKQKSPQNVQVDKIVADAVGMDVAQNLRRTEERRLKVDIKRGVIQKSKVLMDMIKRCPHLEQTIQNILDGKKKGKKSPVKAKTKESDLMDVSDSDNNVNKTNGGPVKRKKSEKKETRASKKRKLNTTGAQKISKKPRYDKKVKDWVEDLGSDDTDEEDRDTDDQGDDIDRYQEDGFVTYDKDDEESGSESRDSDSDDSGDTDDPVAELNDLYDDHISNRVKSDPTMTEAMLNDINKKIKEIRENQAASKIDIAKVMIENFNKEDSLWFYKNIKRVPLLEGQERFDLEDKIEKRYKLLKSLQEANMYDSFNAGDDRDTTKDIMASRHPAPIKRMLLNKMYTVTNESMEEYQKALNWMDTVLNIPTEVKSSKQDIGPSIKRLYEKLHQNLYGMDNAIKQILQAVCTILTDPNNEGYILTLVGPPGVGKTTISTLIAEAIGMGFGQVSCGSIADQATIVGHGSTYIGSKPGVFTQCLINNGQLDNVILLDEMDKMYDSKILPILLHVLDRSQNSRFKDAFCPEVDIDLSKNLYIVAVNSLDSFDDALKDRLKVVYIDGYDTTQKTEICTKHIIPRLIKKTSIGTEIDPMVVKRCVETVSPQISGVRDLERFFGDIYEKLLLVKHMGGSLFDLPANFKVDKKIDMKMIQRLTGLN